MNNNNENAVVQGVKHTVFDSVFKDLFGDINNVRKVYLKLHPQDTDVTISDGKGGGSRECNADVI